MSENVIGYYSRRYVVETGITERYYHLAETVWNFERGFHTLDDAQVYAERISEDHPHVRVVDRGEMAGDE